MFGGILEDIYVISFSSEEEDNDEELKENNDEDREEEITEKKKKKMMMIMKILVIVMKIKMIKPFIFMKKYRKKEAYYFNYIRRIL